MRRLIVLTAFALLVPAAAADARVVIGKSIAGVTLGSPVERAIERLGQPESDRQVADEIQGTVRVVDFGATVVRAGASSGMVQSIDTTSRAERLGNGIGVGSTRKTLRAKVKRVRCSGRICSVGQFVPGATVTTFRIGSTGKITAIGLGYVID